MLRINSVLSLSLSMHLDLMAFFNKLCQEFYKFDLLPYVTHSPKPGSKRRTCFNPFSVKLNVPSCPFFMALSMPIYFLNRHDVIDEPSVDSVNKIRRFILSKHLHLDNICSYFVCCNCSKYRVLKSLV